MKEGNTTMEFQFYTFGVKRKRAFKRNLVDVNLIRSCI